MDSINGYGFFDQGDDAIREEYAGKHWACYQCARPDYEMVRYALDGSQTLVIRCPVNRFAPFAGSSRCPSFEQDPQLLELR